MIQVELKHWTNTDPYKQISWSATNYYNDHEMDFNGKPLDVENQLFLPAHHTTHEHFLFTYFIEGISVSGITFGIHLARNPFYNSEQRSGRFCFDMFSNPNYDQIQQYVCYYWPELSNKQIRTVMDFIRKGIDAFQNNLEKATEIAAEFIRQERTFASEKYIEKNAKKFAQEQLRNFVSTIFPTGDTFTIDLIALISDYWYAWNPPMLDLTQKLADCVIEKWPRMKYAFKRMPQQDYFVKLFNFSPNLVFKPREIVDEIKIHPETVYPDFNELHPVDSTLFHPKFMNNNLSEICSHIEISVATMGQDHRHRMIDQGEVKFKGNFYLPPIVKECGLENEASDLIRDWIRFYSDDTFPKTLVNMIVPYGAVVAYEKKSNFNPLFHEQFKRLCWCTQEEIFNLNRQKRQSVIKKIGEDHPLINMFSPPCIRCEKCTEGSRYCGRNRSKSPFIQRRI